MLDPLDSNIRPFFAALRKNRTRTFVMMSIENALAHGWRLIAWILFFCGLWMFGTAEFFGNSVATILSLTCIMGIIYFIRTDLLRYTLPNSTEIDKRIEKRNTMPRGNIALIEDDLSNPRKHDTRTLWSQAQHRALSLFKSLKYPNMPLFPVKKDRYALRYLAFLTFICGFFVAGHQWKDRIAHGLFPIAPSLILSKGSDTHLWVKPPKYTRMAPIHITGNTSDTIKIPEGSIVQTRIHSRIGGYLAPVFNAGETQTPMNALGDHFYDAETTITQGDKIFVSQGFLTHSSWHYDYIIDAPPTIQHDQTAKTNHVPPSKPSIESSAKDKTESKDDVGPDKKETNKKNTFYEVMDNKHLRFPLVVNDDYGVKELRVTMTRDETIDEFPLGADFNETRLVMSGANADFKISPVYDMTWHTWAGLPVTFSYEVIDHKGQTASLTPITLVLPERHFEHPMAQSLITTRQRLAWDYRDSFIEMAQNLETLLSAPDYFQNDPVIYLAIRTAASRLYYSESKPQKQRTETARAVINLLWNAAIVIEDGNLSLAMRELNEARRALENAMRDPLSNEDEIARLMENLSEKMQNYFTEMQRDMQKKLQNGENIPQFSEDQFSQMITPDHLSKMMQDIEQALRDGDEQKAQELMSQLQRMMEMLDPSMMAELPSDMKMMEKGINELQELIERQEELLKNTQTIVENQSAQEKRQKRRPPLTQTPSLEQMLKDFGMDGGLPPTPQRAQTPSEENNAQETHEPQNKTDVTHAHETEQKALRYILGQLMLDAAEKIGDIPESMGKAEQEMRKSEDALGKQAYAQSIPHQEKAIKYLNESQDELNKQLQQRMKQMIGIGFSGGRPDERHYDPLGRPIENDDEIVPDEAQKKRVDEILRSLRERSGDRSLSDETRDYFRRLLRQF